MAGIIPTIAIITLRVNKHSKTKADIVRLDKKRFNYMLSTRETL